MQRLLLLKKAHPEAKLVVGNTEVGIEMKFKDARYPVLIGATHVPELNKVCAAAWFELSVGWSTGSNKC